MVTGDLDGDADGHVDGDPEPDEVPSRSPADVVDEWQRRAWGDCDLSAVDELVAEPFVRHGMTGSAKRTHDELKHDLREYQKALGSPIITVHDRVVDGDKVWSRTTMSGANLHTGEPHTIDFIQIHRLAGGKITEVWTLHATNVQWKSLG